MSRPLPADVAAATRGDSAAVAAHILAAANRVIARDGLTAATSRAVAEEAGLGAGTLYNYFGNRIGLLAAAIVERARELTTPVGELPARAGRGPIAANLASFAEQAAGVLDELVPLFAAAFADTALLIEIRRRMAEAGLARGPGTAVEEYLRAERDLGRIAADADCGGAAALVVALCHDDAFHGHLEGPGTKRRSRHRELELIVRSLTTPGPPSDPRSTT